MKKLQKFFILLLTVFMLNVVNVSQLVHADAPPQDAQNQLDIVATAYAPGAHDNGKWGDLTHMGTKVRPGVVAVDPNVIPLGSRVYIQFADGHGVYAQAEDTGGAIKGNRIDIAMSSVDEANDFGMKNVTVFVLNK
ncbi:3D (Asp-Asp-Asp) domain-containing protein [Sporomusaceae bacterium BoRhaA]|uniref:3D domain-containing protein n=1 Tax=Pelorhabdus rhamnosifermentans TaxID=2772457 RepID=UPI001C05F9DF|nr:3D domain-containing protein [Pelorhabdus rhamnosifermentans]MBU2700344.1 3D (Asp-Asp-Asp) domain-containing protein [Pelorhabdus rhamnosifermentans]